MPLPEAAAPAALATEDPPAIRLKALRERPPAPIGTVTFRPARQAARHPT